MTRIIEKRLCLHKTLTEQQRQNSALKSRLAQLQPLAGIGTATSIIAHEINNLLTPLAGFAALALNNPDDKALTEKALQKTARNCERASKITESILAMANGRTQPRQNAQLTALLEDVFACLCRDFAKDGITVEIRISESLTVWTVPIQLKHVLMNLILNARDAMLPAGGILTIKAAERTDVVLIEVADTGRGIEPADLKNVFEPFFTTKTDGTSPSRNPGSGLGLVFCKQIIDAHHGSISVESEPARGTTFKITLPKIIEN